MSVQTQPEGDGVLNVKFEPDTITDALLSQVSQLVEQPQSQPQSQLLPQTQPSSQSQPAQPPQSQPVVPPPVLSEWESLLAQVQNAPYDTNRWKTFVDKAEESGDLDKIKKAYDSLLEKYPNASSAQIAYLNHYLTNPALFPVAEALFARFLRNSSSVELWKCYIIYVRRVNTGPTTRDTVRQAYEFALRHVGQDKDSGELWSEYIQYVRSGEASTTWEEQQKMDALRKIYHRAVQIPLDNVEAIWRELDAFENGLNKITAKKFLSDLNPAYMTARTALRELRQHMSRLFPPSPPSSSTRPPLNLPQKPTFSPKEREFVGHWKSYLKWEESNPLDIEDKATLKLRVQAAYQKATATLRFHPEIWFWSFRWTFENGKQEEALAVLRAGMEAIPTSPGLCFAYAEQQELLKDFPEVRKTYDKLLGLMQVELEAIESRTSSANSSFSSNAGAGAGGSGPNGTPVEADSSSKDAPNGDGQEFSFASSQKSDDKPVQSQELKERKQEYGVVYVMYIRFALRSEGVEASRQIFAKARKDKWTPWIVFEAAALMEYHVAKQLGVANKILGLAHSRFPDEIDFVIRYLGFLMSVNDENNARALFERAVTQFPPDKARPLWERWARYEYQYGSLDAALKLEKRMMEVYPNDPPMKRFAQRHTYLHIDGIASRDLGFSMRPQTTGLSRTETLTSINSASQPSSQAQLQSSTSKRGASPDRPRRDDATPDTGVPPHKRARPTSPPPRDRDRRDASAKGGARRFGSPAWERERERDRSPAGARRGERDEPEKPPFPKVLSRFLNSLPGSTSFDGPVFRTDDLMALFRNAVIPSASGIRPRTPPPVRSGRPPPDYGPYHGPSSGRGGRRY